MYITYILLIYLSLGLINNFVYELNLFQQSGYKFHKYIKTFPRYFYKEVSSYLRLLILILTIIFQFNHNILLGILIMFLMLGITIFNKKVILKIKLTKRMLRLILLISLIQLFVMINPLIVVSIEIYLTPLIIVINNLIILPIENLIKQYYIKLSKKKLLLINPLCIGITGSFGKTSTKNFCYELLKDNYLTTKSSKSYNTEMGLCKSIKKDLTYGDEIYIAEMGATRSKDIEKLVNFVNIDIGIITDIGIQHLESFKTIENILKTKLEILKSKNIKTLIINNDNEYLKNYTYSNNINLVRVGTDVSSDIIISNIIITLENIEFDILLDQKYHIKTNIIGKHNVINIAIAITLAYSLGVDIFQIIERLKNIESIKHRLETKIIGIHKVIDNSFNSNLQGFKNNVDLLSLSKEFKVIITPGLVELNRKTKDIHQELARYIYNKIDYVYLIDNPNTNLMKNEFEKMGFTNYVVIDSFASAFKLALNSTQKSTILIENDLTDYYMNGGI